MKKTILTVLAVVGLVLSGLTARAEGKAKEWKENHPRRAEVNKRLGNQNKRINQGVKSGELTKGQAAQLHKEDRSMRREERRMAAKDGGHITKADQRKLNRQENRESKQIYDEKHPGQGAGTTPTPAASATPQ